MKIIGLTGSPRKSDNTAWVVEKIASSWSLNANDPRKTVDELNASPWRSRFSRGIVRFERVDTIPAME